MTEAAEGCTAKAAQPTHTIEIRRMAGLETAAKMLGGQRQLGDTLGINARSVRAKLTADRGISDADLRSTAAELEWRAGQLIGHARKLRALVP